MQQQEKESIPSIPIMRDLVKDNHHKDRHFKACLEDLQDKTHQMEEEMIPLDESFAPLQEEEEIHQEEEKTPTIQMILQQTYDLDERIYKAKNQLSSLEIAIKQKLSSLSGAFITS
jgi:hypothetical protein